MDFFKPSGLGTNFVGKPTSTSFILIIAILKVKHSDE
jgi:hypothetical protein